MKNQKRLVLQTLLIFSGILFVFQGNALAKKDTRSTQPVLGDKEYKIDNVLQDTEHKTGIILQDKAVKGGIILQDEAHKTGIILQDQAAKKN